MLWPLLTLYIFSHIELFSFIAPASFLHSFPLGIVIAPSMFIYYLLQCYY